MLNKKVRLIITAALSAALLLSGCGDSAAELVDETISESTVSQTSAETTTTTEATTAITTMTETTTETETEITTETETTQERELTPEEVNLMNDMPEIVFIKLYNYPYPNISKGYYIDKHGAMSYFEIEDEDVFDYRKIIYDSYSDPKKIEVTVDFSYMTDFCEEMKSSSTETSPDAVNEVTICNLYKALTGVNKDSTVKCWEDPDTVLHPQYGVYGIRSAENGDKEMILLREYGGIWNVSVDTAANDLFEQLNGIFPEIESEPDELPIMIDLE